MPYTIAAIDVHKKVLMVAVADMSAPEADQHFEHRRFGATRSELQALAAWLEQRAVQEVVMESTAQYWKLVWLALESHTSNYTSHRPSPTARRAAASLTSAMPSDCSDAWSPTSCF